MFLKKIFLILLTVLLPLLAFSSELIHGPYMQDARSTQITIKWETKNAEKGKVLYGTNSSKLSQKAEEKNKKTLHEVTLNNLTPNTHYFYQCVWQSGKSETGRFKTAPADDSTPMRLAFVGDSRSDLEMCKKISDLIIERDPAIVVHTGDIVASGKKLEQWETYLFNPMENLLRNIPIYPVLGNHEEESPYYYDYFSIHNGKPWWSVDYGSVHLIGLDTNLPCGEGSEQYNFLLADLKKNKKQWTIVVFHHPLFNCHPTRESSPLRYTLQPLFMKYGVDLVITGHDHYYHRSFPIGNMAEKQDGVIHITTAGGGASLYTAIQRPYSAYYRPLYHFLTVDVTDKDLIVRAINDSNQCFDAIVVNKQNQYPPPEFVEYEMFNLEKELNISLGKVLPKSNAKGEIFFDTTFTVKTNFYMPLKGSYQWQASKGWTIETDSNPLKVDKGAAISIKFKGKTDKNNFMPTPTLKLHLEADNSTRNVTHRPYQPYLGFRNQDLEFSLEKAAYKAAVLAPPGDIQPLLTFLDYYGNSQYAFNAIVALGSQIMQTHDKRIFEGLQQILRKNPTDINKYRIYPFYFLYNDFSHLEEWINAMDKVPADQRSFSPKLICILTDLDNFNSHLLKNWHIAGPFMAQKNANAAEIVFPPEKNQSLTQKYKSASGTISWQAYNQPGKEIDFMEYFKNPDLSNESAAVYASTEVEAKKDGKVLLLLGSDDDPAIWINGKEVFRKDVGRGLHACNDVIPVSLKKGKNRIMIKVAQRGGGWGLTLKVSDWQKILK